MIWVTEVTGEETLRVPGHRKHWSVLRKVLGLCSSGPRVTGKWQEEKSCAVIEATEAGIYEARISIQPAQ